MIGAALTAAAEAETAGDIWTVVGITITTLGMIFTARAAARAKKNTEPNGGSSPHDAVLAELASVRAEVGSVRCHVETMDERAVIEQRRAETVRGELLDGQARLERTQRQQAATIDRILLQLDATGAQAEAAVDLITQYHQTGG